jgi:myo-inositol-1-phosphate synthase
VHRGEHLGPAGPLEPPGRVGAWFVGARGSVATTARVGAAALAGGLALPQGLVTALPAVDRPGLPGVADLVFGGHDPASTPLAKRADALAAAGVLPPALLPAVADTLERTERNLRPGLDATRAGGPPRRAVDRAAGEIAAFRARHGLETVVVVNLASTEADSADCPPDLTAEALDARLDDPGAVVPVGVLAACAAVCAGCPFVDFTPSVATRTPALAELAAARNVPYAGRDGKTGETLVKSALAPLFAYRNLPVRSWSGTNLLGGSDGAALADPDRAASKVASKRRALAAILGEEPAGPLHIDYVPDLGEWKTAWDHVAFEGFLGTRMTLQFTWQGCDSALAAPLVLDLVRLVAAAHRAGHVGALGALGFFFKDPIGTSEHALERQFQRLCAWVDTLPGPGPGPEPGPEGAG